MTIRPVAIRKLVDFRRPFELIPIDRLESKSMSPTIVSASAAAVACLTALYVGVIRPRLQMPRLTILPFDHDPYRRTQVLRADGWRGGWTRVQVLNYSRSKTAEDVQLMIVGVVDSNGAPIEAVAPLSGRFLKCSGHATNSAPIPAGVAIRFDLIEFSQRSETSASGKRFAIYPPSQIPELIDLAVPTPFEVVLAVCGKDTSARFFEVSVTLADDWAVGEHVPAEVRVRKIKHFARHGANGRGSDGRVLCRAGHRRLPRS